ncbi:MAG: aromatic ring-hydroxylating dioxygenase subunit alpha [Xanthomonadales bacterium]|nr:aromatic ring-hydroxylating dioxygenase subunit alpha [Xanthomonadales bacterium]
MNTVEPLDRARALAVPYYVDPDWARREQQAVFARSWQLAAHEGELADPGDHVATEIAGRPVLIVRQADGSLRGFYNVCKHRAGPLALCNGRGARALHCKYHGWTYTLEGQLRSAPEMDGAADFDKSTIRLDEIRVSTWQGLVFVALDADVPPLDTVYAGINERIRPVEPGRMRFHRRTRYDIACNWKVYVDNFLEGYHLPHVHPGLSKVLDYRAYDTELFDWYSLQHSPIRDAGDIYGDGDAWYYYVYPNVMLNIMPGRMQTNRVLPQGIDRCVVEFDFYYSDDPAALARADRDEQFSDEIQQEDISICEAVQKGLTSGAYEPGRLCPKREGGVWHFQNLMRQAYAAA